MGPVTITRPGVILCAQISVKTVSLMVAFMALLATMTVDTLGHTLNRLRLPDKMVHMLLITYRYLFVIEQEYQRLVRAMKIRNFHPEDQPAQLPNLCLPGGDAVCPGLGAGPPGAQRHDLPGVQRSLCQPS